MKKAITIKILILLFLLGFSGSMLAAHENLIHESHLPVEHVRALILSVEEPSPQEEQIQNDFYQNEQKVEVRVLTGEYKGEELTINHFTVDNPAYDIPFEVGDKVFMDIQLIDGEIVGGYITELVRDNYLLYMVIAFGLAIIIIGGLKGIKSVISLVLTVFLVVKLLLPYLLKGYNPILLAIIVSAIVSTVCLSLVGGLNRKTLAAVIGTVGGVAIAGLIAFYIGNAIKLTGLSGEEIQMLFYVPQGITFDYRGLLFAGIIIGSLGAVMDVGMSVASSVSEIKRANPSMEALQLFKSGMNVGRDIMGTMSNTLILAYTGSALPLLLLFTAYEFPIAEIINMDLIASEIVRALSGSIGLTLCIPITAFLAGFLNEA